MKNQVQLIAYVDRLGGTLPGLRDLLRGPLAGLFGGVHLLPFFDPIDGADAGFDPIDHAAVDRRLGSWRDVRRIADTTDVMADLIVNHISCRSPQFRDFLAHGSHSAWSGMFLSYDDVFPGGATEQDLQAIYRPRPGLPFTVMNFGDGTQRRLWTTFTAEQIDLNVTHPAGQAYLDSILRTLSAGGVSSVRLDAIGYAIKQAGTSCFMLPETYAFIAGLASRAAGLGLEVLVEIHSWYQDQIDIARRVGWVYDFALPPLVLHALFMQSSRALKHWIGIRPVNAVTVLDTHDGIGVIDIGADQRAPRTRPGLVPDDELDALVEQIHLNSRDESRLATGAAASNLDLYQVNCTYFDALGRDELKYLLARAIQFFVPGVPQVYYVGLFAGSNDMELLARTGVGRDINRHHFGQEEITDAIARPVVQRLFDLIRLRNSHPAFDGQFAMAPTSDTVLELSWRNGNAHARLRVDFATLDYRIDFSRDGSAASLVLGPDQPGGRNRVRLT